MRAITVLALALSAPVAASAQSAGGTETETETGSYQYLTEPRRQPLGNFVDAERYRRLSKTQRSTYESIVHALEAVGRLDIVQVVTAIWGGDPGSNDGKDQFRLSVILADGAVEDLLEEGSGFTLNRALRPLPFGPVLGHVKLPSGEVVGSTGADSVKEDGRVPKIQISWLEADRRVGEIDIDYREWHNGHNHPANSDVTSELPDDGTPHYTLHEEDYGEGLVPWWR